MQFFILLTGVMVFVFFQFESSPLHFNPKAVNSVLHSSKRDSFLNIGEQQKKIQLEQKNTALLFSEAGEQTDTREKLGIRIKQLNRKDSSLRKMAKGLIERSGSDAETNDKDYVFIYFILNYLPKGVVGLLIAVILSAAMSSTSSELNALGATTTIDLYKRNMKSEKSDKHYLNASRLFTLMWGTIAILFACLGSLSENLIQFVNIVGSIFYGNVLGIFLIAFFIKAIKARAVFYSAIITQLMVFYIYKEYVASSGTLGYLWLNFIGCVLVISIATITTLVQGATKKGA
jgi:hypothetical protein